MKVFITGATGYIGFAVASAFSAKGYQVFGLARSEEKARKLAAIEVTPVMGSMDNPSSYTKTASSCEILIHCAAEWSDQFHELDRKTVDAFLKATSATGSKHKIIYTSGVWLYGNTQNKTVDENTEIAPVAIVVPRVATEEKILNASNNNISTIIVRPGCVYGETGGLTASWFNSATANGAAEIVGDGNFSWAMIHIQDLADAYIRIVESTFAKEIFNVTDRSRATVLECARAANRAAGKNSSVKSIPVLEAAKTLGQPMVEALTLNQHVDSSKISQLLDWQPRHENFIDGVSRYFAAWKALTESTSTIN